MIIFDRNDYTWFLSFIERFFDFWQKTFASFQKLRFTCPKDFSEESKASIRTINLISFGPWAGNFSKFGEFLLAIFQKYNQCLQSSFWRKRQLLSKAMAVLAKTVSKSVNVAFYVATEPIDFKNAWIFFSSHTFFRAENFSDFWPGFPGRAAKHAYFVSGEFCPRDDIFWEI